MSENTFTATAWKEGEDEIHSGELSFSEHVLEFMGESRACEVELVKLELKIRGGKSPSVEFSNPDRSAWTISVEGLDILDVRSLRARTSIRRQIEDYEDSKDSLKRLAATALFFIGFIALSSLAGVMVEAAMPKMLAMIPPDYELEMTAEVIDEVWEAVPEEYEATNTVNELQGLLDRILPQNQRGVYKFELYLLNDLMPNAFAMPGGKIFVYTGLLEMSETTEEVAGVLAHEIAHVMHRHSLRQLIANAGPLLVFDRILGADAGVLSLVAAGSSFMIKQGFSRDHESEADDMAFDYLVEAGIDPRGLETFLNKLIEDEEPLADYRALLSHPPSKERVAALQKRWKNLADKPDFTPLEPLDFEPPYKETFEDKVDRMMKRYDGK